MMRRVLIGLRLFDLEKKRLRIDCLQELKIMDGPDRDDIEE